MSTKTKATKTAAAKEKETKPVTKAKPASKEKAPVVAEKPAVKAKVETKATAHKAEPKKVEHKAEPKKVEHKAEPKVEPKAELKTVSLSSPKEAEPKKEKTVMPVKEVVVEKVVVEVAAPEKKKPVAARPGVKPLAHAVGRRKTAVARVWFTRGTGKIVVNGEPYSEYFDTEIMRLDAATAFRVCPIGAHYDASATVRGGGLGAQAGAVRLGISRALVSLHEETRLTLREHGLLTVDSRTKERKKYGQKAARRKFQFVKR